MINCNRNYPSKGIPSERTADKKDGGQPFALSLVQAFSERN